VQHSRPEAPANGIIQIAYHVADIQASMAALTARLGIGPWFLLEHAVPAGALYRSQPTNVDINAAFGFSNDMQYELIQQLNDAPSVYRDHQASHGYGFHHWGRATTRFDDDVETQRSQGRAAQFLIKTALTRLAYIDARPDVPGFIELIEWTPGWSQRYAAMQAQTRDWDGQDPVRPISSLR
jgi:hypothetical protein